MPRIQNINGVRRRPRGGRLVPLERMPKVSEGDRRRFELSKAVGATRESLPKLNALLSKWANELRTATEAEDRYAHIATLVKVYKKVLRWRDKKILDERFEQVALLRGRRPRKNSNIFCEVVGAVGDRADCSPQTANRWANKLKDALSNGIPASGVEVYLRS